MLAAKHIGSGTGCDGSVKSCHNTPHDAELAELGDELLGKVLLLKSIYQTGRAIPLVDGLWAVHDRKKIDGITDLRPRNNGGNSYLACERPKESRRHATSTQFHRCGAGFRRSAGSEGPAHGTPGRLRRDATRR